MRSSTVTRPMLELRRFAVLHNWAENGYPRPAAGQHVVHGLGGPNTRCRRRHPTKTVLDDSR